MSSKYLLLFKFILMSRKLKKIIFYIIYLDNILIYLNKKRSILIKLFFFYELKKI